MIFFRPIIKLFLPDISTLSPPRVHQTPWIAQHAVGARVRLHQGEGSACIRGRGRLACLAMASWVALLMSGECTVAKPEASSACDLACTSCRLGMSHPLVATDCRKSNCQQACSHYNTSQHMVDCALTAQVADVPSSSCHRRQAEQQR